MLLFLPEKELYCNNYMTQFTHGAELQTIISLHLIYYFVFSVYINICITDCQQEILKQFPYQESMHRIS